MIVQIVSWTYWMEMKMLRAFFFFFLFLSHKHNNRIQSNQFWYNINNKSVLLDENKIKELHCIDGMNEINVFRCRLFFFASLPSSSYCRFLLKSHFQGGLCLCIYCFVALTLLFIVKHYKWNQRNQQQQQQKRMRKK